MVQLIMYIFVTFVIFKEISCSDDDLISLEKMDPRKDSNKFSIVENAKRVVKEKLFDKNITEDGMLDFTGLAEKYIRPAQKYSITTEDGYILKLFNIPGNKSNVVLVCHGILVTSDAFLLRGNISLVYMLAEQGLDVWVMNFRGNTYSRNHVTLDPDTDKKFWDYYMHEIGIYDYKCVIDFVLERTEQEKMSVIAHSEGGAAFFVLMSEKPEYNDKIKVFVGLAPACYLSNSGLASQAMLNILPKLSILLRAVGLVEVASFNSFGKTVFDVLCSQGELGYEFCFAIMGFLSGPINPKNIEPEFLPTLLGHIPAGSGLKNMEHFGHIYRYNRFCKYDHSLYIRNFVEYNSSSPSDYDLSKVTTKVALFSAKNDLIIGVEDIKKLKNNLQNVVHYQQVSDDTFNHLDYMWSRNAHKVLYPDIIDILNKYENT